MLYLSAWPSATYSRGLMEAHGIGAIISPQAGYRAKLMASFQGKWAADNGCFNHGATFELDSYLNWLTHLLPAQPTCLFATAPDVVGDAEATWERSRDALPMIRSLGYRAALVAQDGLRADRLDWGAFDALFIGGSTDWKLSEAAYELAREAQLRGKWTHMGRVNTLRRLRAAKVGGYQSVDGTTVIYGPKKNLPLLIRWLDELEVQPHLWHEEVGSLRYE